MLSGQFANPLSRFCGRSLQRAAGPSDGPHRDAGRAFLSEAQMFSRISSKPSLGGQVSLPCRPLLSRSPTLALCVCILWPPGVLLQLLLLSALVLIHAPCPEPRIHVL